MGLWILIDGVGSEKRLKTKMEDVFPFPPIFYEMKPKSQIWATPSCAFARSTNQESDSAVNHDIFIASDKKFKTNS